MLATHCSYLRMPTPWRLGLATQQRVAWCRFRLVVPAGKKTHSQLLAKQSECCTHYARPPRFSDFPELVAAKQEQVARLAAATQVEDSAAAAEQQEQAQEEEVAAPEPEPEPQPPLLREARQLQVSTVQWARNVLAPMCLV